MAFYFQKKTGELQHLHKQQQKMIILPHKKQHFIKGESWNGPENVGGFLETGKSWEISCLILPKPTFYVLNLTPPRSNFEKKNNWTHKNNGGGE